MYNRGREGRVKKKTMMIVIPLLLTFLLFKVSLEDILMVSFSYRCLLLSLRQ